MTNVNSIEIVKSKNIEEIVVELFEDKTTMTVMHKWVKVKKTKDSTISIDLSKYEERIYPIVVLYIAYLDQLYFVVSDRVEFQFWTIHQQEQCDILYDSWTIGYRKLYILAEWKDHHYE